MQLWQCYELSLIDDGVCGWWQQGKGIVSLQEGKGLVSQISNLKAAAVQKDKSLAQLRETKKGMKDTSTQWEIQLEAQLTAKLQDQASRKRSQRTYLWRRHTMQNNGREN